MSRNKDVVRMTNAIKSCQRPWPTNNIGVGSLVTIEGLVGVFKVSHLNCRPRYSACLELPRNLHYKSTMAFVHDLHEWIPVNRMTRW